jgi:hypothetical protein
MTARGFTQLVGAILLAIGIGGLLWPLAPDAGKGDGVTCNNALVLKLEDAETQDSRNKIVRTMSRFAAGRTDLVEQCESAAQIRRLVFWPIAGAGAITLAGAVLIRPRASAATS